MNLFFQLPVVIQVLLKGMAVIGVMFPLAGACSMAERKISAWIQGRPGLSSEIDSGKVKVVISFSEDLTAAGISESQLSKVQVIYIGTHHNKTTGLAAIVIPSLTVFEKSGTFINQQFRIQKFVAAVPGPSGVVDDLVILTHLTSSLHGTAVQLTQAAGLLAQTWTSLSATIPSLAPLSFSTIPETGLLVDSTAFTKLPFVETETLHFKPVV